VPLLELGAPAAITIGIDPTIELGPVTLAWHGIMIAVGILAGAALAGRIARRWGMPTDPMYTAAVLAGAAGLVGGRLLYVVERGLLDEPGEWFSTQGFSFNGGFALAAAVIAFYVWRSGLPLRYLDALAVGLPLGVAVGRIGDIINGEHYGPPTDFFLGVRNTHPDASVPSPDVAYHSGGLYDSLLGLVVFAVVWPMRNRIRTPTMLVWLVIGLIGAGRFVEFFWRSDSDAVALGLNSAQWTSLALVVAAVGGALVARRLTGRQPRGAPRSRSTVSA
jgi:phosphatidylglycerol:prolipoprotein diacylglycerol transferase